jgi:prephenate dehydrogenase
MLAFSTGELEAAFARSRDARADLPSAAKGFLSRLWELRVVVEDRPGMIADISGHLYAKGINIKDIEVLKVREGETGSVRLAFESRAIAEEALRELSGAGYQARLRE